MGTVKRTLTVYFEVRVLHGVPDLAIFSVG